MMKSKTKELHYKTLLKRSFSLKDLARPAKLTPAQLAEVRQTADDFKHSLLIVSLVVNVFMLTAWLVIEASNGQIFVAYL